MGWDSGFLKLSQPCQDQKCAVSGIQGLELGLGLGLGWVVAIGFWPPSPRHIKTTSFHVYIMPPQIKAWQLNT